MFVFALHSKLLSIMCIPELQIVCHPSCRAMSITDSQATFIARGVALGIDASVMDSLFAQHTFQEMLTKVRL